MKFTKLVVPLGIILAMSLLYGKRREEAPIQVQKNIKAAPVTVAEEFIEKPNIEWVDIKPNGDELEKKLASLTKMFEAALLKKYPDAGSNKLEEFKKVAAEHKGELDKLEKNKDDKKINYIVYLVEKGVINSKYKAKYEKFETKASILQSEWDEDASDLWQAWDAEDKKKYNKEVRELDDLMKAVSEKEKE